MKIRKGDILSGYGWVSGRPISGKAVSRYDNLKHHLCVLVIPDGEEESVVVSTEGLRNVTRNTVYEKV